MAQNELNLYVSNRGEDNQLVDWTKAAGSLTSGILAASGMRDLRRKENEQVKQSALDAVGKKDNLTDQSLDKFKSNGAFAGRNKVVELNTLMKNGDISRAEHKAALSTLTTNWNNTAEYMKNLDKVYAEKLQRKEKNIASTAELELIEYIGQLNNIGDKAITFDNNGNVLIAIMDKEGNPTGAYQDINALNNMMNTTIDKVDVDGMIDVTTENWDKEWQKYNKTDIRQSGDIYNKNVQTLVNQIIPDSRSIAAVLTDYAGFGTYFDENQKDEALRKLRLRNPDATEADLIFGKQDIKGFTTYTINANQLKTAEDLIKNKIEQRFASKTEYAPSSGGGGGLTANQQAESAEQKRKDISLWRLTYDAFNNPSGINTPKMAQKLTTASGGEFIFTARKDGGYNVKNKSGTIIAGYGNPGDSDYLAPLKNSRDAWRVFKRDDTYWNQLYDESGLGNPTNTPSKKGSSNNKGKTTPKTTVSGGTGR